MKRAIPSLRDTDVWLMARSPDKSGQTMFKLKTYETTELKEETWSEKGFQKSRNMNTDI